LTTKEIFEMQWLWKLPRFYRTTEVAAMERIDIVVAVVEKMTIAADQCMS
jgi:hypothetical protein